MFVHLSRGSEENVPFEESLILLLLLQLPISYQANNRPFQRTTPRLGYFRHLHVSSVGVLELSFKLL